MLESVICEMASILSRPQYVKHTWMGNVWIEKYLRRFCHVILPAPGLGTFVWCVVHWLARECLFGSGPQFQQMSLRFLLALYPWELRLHGEKLAVKQSSTAVVMPCKKIVGESLILFRWYIWNCYIMQGLIYPGVSKIVNWGSRLLQNFLLNSV